MAKFYNTLPLILNCPVPKELSVEYTLRNLLGLSSRCQLLGNNVIAIVLYLEDRTAIFALAKKCLGILLGILP